MDMGGQGRTYKNKKARQHKAQKTTLIVLGYRQIIKKMCLKQASLGTYICEMDRWVLETF